MANAETFKQELPPEGGYQPLNFERTFPKKVYSMSKFVLANLICTSIWVYYSRPTRQQIFLDRLQEWNTFIACEPTIAAERDRAYLKHLRYNRDEEEDLMKNYPGWVNGTYFGEPVYKTLPENYLRDPSLAEYYIHTRLKYLSEYAHAEMLYH